MYDVIIICSSRAVLIRHSLSGLRNGADSLRHAMLPYDRPEGAVSRKAAAKL